MPAEIGIKVGADIKELATATSQANAYLRSLDKQFGAVASGGINTLKQRITDLKETLGNLSQTKLKSGFGDVLSKDLDFSKSKLKELEQAAAISGAKTGNALQKGFSGLRTLANILPGIGIAGIFGVIISGAGELVTALIDAGNSANFLKDKLEESNKAVALAEAATAGERAELQSLVAIAGDETLSRNARTEALKKLQKEYPAYFQNIKFDGNLTENLKTATDKLTQSILLNAKAKALQKQIDESAQRVAEKQNSSLFDNLGVLGKLKAIALSAGGANIGQDIKIANIALKDFNELSEKEAQLQKELAKQLTDTNTKLAVQGSLFDDKKKKGLTDTQSLEKQISALEKLKKELGAAFSTADEFKLSNLKIQLNDLEPNLTASEKLRFNEKLKQDFFASGIKITVPAQVSFEGTLRDQVQQQVNKGFDIKKAIKTTGGFDKVGDATIDPKLQQQADHLKDIQDRAQQTADVLTNTLKPAFDDVFKAIFEGGGNALKAFANAIAQVVQKLIAAAIEAAIFAAITTAITGGSAAGGKSFFSNFKGLFSSFSGLPKFAEGGFTGTSGPSSGFLAVLHPNEIVVPLDKATKGLRNVDAGNDRVITGTITAEGDKLVTLVNVVNKRKGRTG